MTRLRQFINFINIFKISYKNRLYAVKIPYNSYNLELCLYLKKKNWIINYNFDLKIKDENKITMNLRYIKNKPFFKNLQVISTPGHHKYARISNLQGSINGDIYLFTDKGFLSLKEAKEFGIGGEYGIYIQF